MLCDEPPSVLLFELQPPPLHEGLPACLWPAILRFKRDADVEAFEHVEKRSEGAEATVAAGIGGGRSRCRKCHGEVASEVQSLESP